MTDQPLRKALRVEQQVALALLRGMGERKLSERKLAEEAKVDVKLVRGVLQGTSWTTFYTASRLLHVVGAHLMVEEAEFPD